jgi:hypothetical protein
MSDEKFNVYVLLTFPHRPGRTRSSSVIITSFGPR